MISNPLPLEIQDEGTRQGDARKVNFVGAGVSAAVSGQTATVTIAGAAGASWSVVEVNMGTTPVWTGKFTITDAAIGPTSKVIIMHAPGPYTGKGTRGDEAEMDPIVVTATPATGTAEARWSTVPPLFRSQRLNPVQETLNVGGIFLTITRQWVVEPTRMGKVKGNIKFFYTVA